MPSAVDDFHDSKPFVGRAVAAQFQRSVRPSKKCLRGASFMGIALQATPGNDLARCTHGFPQHCPHGSWKTGHLDVLWKNTHQAGWMILRSGRAVDDQLAVVVEVGGGTAINCTRHSEFESAVS